MFFEAINYTVSKGAESWETITKWLKLEVFFSKQHPHPRRQSKRTSPMLFTRNKVLEQYTLMPYLQIFVWFVYNLSNYSAKDQMKRRKIHYCAVWRSALHKSLNSTPFLRLTERCLWVSLWPKRLKPSIFLNILCVCITFLSLRSACGACKNRDWQILNG